MDFRQYDAAIGRFTGIDKLSEEFFSMTPYNFAGNNPVSYMDPSGLRMRPEGNTPMFIMPDIDFNGNTEDGFL